MNNYLNNVYIDTNHQKMDFRKKMRKKKKEKKRKKKPMDVRWMTMEACPKIIIIMKKKNVPITHATTNRICKITPTMCTAIVRTILCVVQRGSEWSGREGWWRRRVSIVSLVFAGYREKKKIKILTHRAIHTKIRWFTLTWSKTITNSITNTLVICITSNFSCWCCVEHHVLILVCPCMTRWAAMLQKLHRK